ncbi:MAG: FIG01122338: hypothetical protein, partial [uncultured Thermomicrobiales bacterium]
AVVAAGAESGRSDVSGLGRRGQAPDPTVLPGMDRPQRQRSGHRLDRTVCLSDRIHDLPPQSRPGQDAHHVSRHHRGPARAAAGRRRRPDLSPLGAAARAGPDPGRDRGRHGAHARLGNPHLRHHRDPDHRAAGSLGTADVGRRRPLHRAARPPGRRRAAVRRLRSRPKPRQRLVPRLRRRPQPPRGASHRPRRPRHRPESGRHPACLGGLAWRGPRLGRGRNGGRLDARLAQRRLDRAVSAARAGRRNVGRPPGALLDPGGADHAAVGSVSLRSLAAHPGRRGAGDRRHRRRPPRRARPPGSARPQRRHPRPTGHPPPVTDPAPPRRPIPRSRRPRRRLARLDRGAGFCPLRSRRSALPLRRGDGDRRVRSRRAGAGRRPRSAWRGAAKGGAAPLQRLPRRRRHRRQRRGAPPGRPQIVARLRRPRRQPPPGDGRRRRRNPEPRQAACRGDPAHPRPRGDRRRLRNAGPPRLVGRGPGALPRPDRVGHRAQRAEAGHRGRRDPAGDCGPGARGGTGRAASLVGSAGNRARLSRRAAIGHHPGGRAPGAGAPDRGHGQRRRPGSGSNRGAPRRRRAGDLPAPQPDPWRSRRGRRVALWPRPLGLRRPRRDPKRAWGRPNRRCPLDRLGRSRARARRRQPRASARRHDRRLRPPRRHHREPAPM